MQQQVNRTISRWYGDLWVAAPAPSDIRHPLQGDQTLLLKPLKKGKTRTSQTKENESEGREVMQALEIL